MTKEVAEIERRNQLSKAWGVLNRDVFLERNRVALKEQKKSLKK
jgi:hypothetical protein